MQGPPAVQRTDFTGLLAQWAENDRKRAVEKFNAEFGRPPGDNLTTEQITRMAANLRKGRQLKRAAEIRTARGPPPAAVADPSVPNKLYINGVNVVLPAGIELYPKQKLMLVRILQCLRAEPPSSALIESATGSGKTMALLSGLSAWLVEYNRVLGERQRQCGKHTNAKDKDAEDPCDCPRRTRVFYCTKTFAQLSQVIKEYRRLPYYREGSLRHTVLAGRDKLCINEKVLKSCGSNTSAITTRCQSKLQTKGGGCRAFTELDRRYGTDPGALRQDVRAKLEPESAFDIEDLHRVLGGLEGGGVCPYFAATDLLYVKADVVFCVYPYVFDPAIRAVKNIDLSNAIVVVDEGHNILDVGCEALTFDFELFRLRELIDELFTCVQHIGSVVEKYKPHEDIAGPMLKDARSRYDGDGMIGKCITKLYMWCIGQMEEIWKAHKFTFFGKPKMVYTLDTESLHSALLELFLDASDDPNVKLTLRDHVGTAYRQFNDFTSNAAAVLLPEDNAKSRPQMSSMEVLRKFFNLLRYYERDPTQFRCTFEMKLADRCGIMDDAVFSKFVREPHSCSVRFWPLTASVCLREITQAARALIVTSGTLSPVEMFESQFGVQFPIRELKLPSVVPAEHIFTAALTTGPLGNAIDGRFESAQNPDGPFYKELAATITAVCSVVPDGVVCFFGSYAILERTEAVLRQREFSGFNKYKDLISESAAGDSKRTMERYAAAVQQGRGALLFAVFRGCISEGINLSHELARCTIIVGLPFPNLSDEYVRIRSAALGGYEWSALHAFIAINQALGRQESLRNKHDWSAILLLDKRYADERNKARLPSWASASLKAFNDFRLLVPELKQFCQKFAPTVARNVPAAGVAQPSTSGAAATNAQ